MKILVTGGSGRIGRYVLRELQDSGHEATSIDVAAPAERSTTHLRVDLTDAGQVYQALTQTRCEAVIHLGAWADAGIVPDTRTYADNVQGTFNVFQACADLGVRRVVFASSAQVYGLAKAPPVYVPLDEHHPLRPMNCYALSKICSEKAADYFVANSDVTILCFRFQGVRTPAELSCDVNQMAAHPAVGCGSLWTRTDTRDAAAACRLAIEKEDVSPGPYNITGSHNVMARKSHELIEEHFGKRTEVRDALEGHRSAMSCARAESAFDYRPRFAWSITDRHLET